MSLHHRRRLPYKSGHATSYPFPGTAVPEKTHRPIVLDSPHIPGYHLTGMILTILLALPAFCILTASGYTDTSAAPAPEQPETAAEPAPNPDDERIGKAYTDLIIAFGTLDAILEGITDKARADAMAPLYAETMARIKTLFAHASSLTPSSEMMEPIRKIYEPELEKYNKSIDTHIGRILTNKCYGSAALQRAFADDPASGEENK